MLKEYSEQTSMKNKSTSQPASARPSLVRRPVGEGGFFNRRGLIGLFLCCTGVFIAFFAFGAPTGPFQPQPQEMGRQPNDAGGYSFSLANTVGSATPSTWGYDPVANTFTERAPFPLPAAGFASSVINGHLYLAGGRDATNTVIQVVWDYDIATNTWTARISMPGTQVDLPESGAALDKLWVFEGGAPFGPIQGASTTAGSAKHADSWSALQSRASATAVGGASTQDWTNLGGNAQRNGMSSAVGPSADELAWSNTDDFSIIAWHPVTLGERAFAIRESGFPGVTANDKLVAYDLATGQELWSTVVPYGGDPNEEWIAYIAGTHDGKVYAARGGSGRTTPIYAFDAETGGHIWTSTFETVAGPQDGVVFAPDGDLIVGDLTRSRGSSRPTGQRCGKHRGLVPLAATAALRLATAQPTSTSTPHRPGRRALRPRDGRASVCHGRPRWIDGSERAVCRARRDGLLRQEPEQPRR